PAVRADQADGGSGAEEEGVVAAAEGGIATMPETISAAARLRSAFWRSVDENEQVVHADPQGSAGGRDRRLAPAAGPRRVHPAALGGHLLHSPAWAARPSHTQAR